MTNTSSIPVSMTNYNESSKLQNRGIENVLHLIAKSFTTDHPNFKRELQSNDGVFSIADFGSSEGKNSLAPMKEIIRLVREVNPKKTITVTHTDLPTNNYSVLYQTVQESKESYWNADDQHLFVYTSGTSFFRGIFPSNSLSYGFSSSAIHFLSSIPGPIPNCSSIMLLHSKEIKTDEEKTALDLYTRHAEKDLDDFFRFRSQELISGGILLVNCVAWPTGQKGTFVEVMNMVVFNIDPQGNPDSQEKPIFTKEETKMILFPVYFRTEEELQPPSLAKYGLKVLSQEKHAVSDPILEAFTVHKNVKQMAEQAAKAIRAFSESSIRIGLAKMGKSKQEQDELANEYYAQYQRKLERYTQYHVPYAFTLVATVYQKI